MAGYIIGGRLVEGGGLDAGEITVRAVPASGWSGELTLNDYGTIDLDLSLPMIDPVTNKRVDLPNLLVPGRDFIGVVENDVILEAGPIEADPFTWPKTSKVVVSGLWSYFDGRYVLPVLSGWQLPRHVNSKWSNLSRRTIAKRLVQQACAHPKAGLPIDYEPDFSGTETREYAGSDMIPVGDALRDLTEEEGGPEIVIRPKWGTDRKHVRWQLITGDTEIKQTGAPHYWDTSVPDAHATIVSLDRDGRDLASRSYLAGKTIRNMVRDGDLRDGKGSFVPGGANGTLNAMVAGSVELALGMKGYSLTSWSGNSGSGNGGAFTENTLTVEPGERYVVSTYANSNTAKSLRLVAQFVDDTHVISQVTVQTATVATSGYSFYSGVVTAPAGAVKMGLFLYPAPGQQWTTGDLLRTTGWLAHEDIDVAVPWFHDELQVQARSDSTLLTDAGFPFTESAETRSSIRSYLALSARANESVLRRSAHIETWTLRVRRDKIPTLGTYLPGDYARVRIGKNPRKPEGTYDVRILTIEYESAGDVTVTCAPERVVSGYPVPTTSRNWFRDKLRGLRKRIDETNRGK